MLHQCKIISALATTVLVLGNSLLTNPASAQTPMSPGEIARCRSGRCIYPSSTKPIYPLSTKPANQQPRPIELTSDFQSNGEVMTDRCSADVAIVPSYDAGPTTPGTVILTRNSNGWTPYRGWTAPFSVGTGGSGHIRWWCHSTRGNIFDPGTWRPELDYAKTGACVVGGIGYIFSGGKWSEGVDQCPGAVKNFGYSAWNGWTPERSRCDSRSSKIRARLAPDRGLQIQCL